MKFSDIELPANRSFGFTFCTILFIASCYFYITDTPMIAIVLFIFAILFLVTSFLRPQLLLPINKLWMYFGFLLGKIVSPIVLGLIFFLMFAPLGLLMRLFGRDELRLNLKDKHSYWKVCENNQNSSNTFKNQF